MAAVHQPPTNNSVPTEPPLERYSSPMTTSTSSNKSRRNRLLLGGSLAAVVLVTVIVILTSYHSSKSPSIQAVNHPTIAVQITNTGFVPADVRIRAGSEVVWTNNTSGNYQVAADPYPTHATLPGLYSQTIPPHGTYSYVFGKVGTWGYQDYLKPTVNGTISVVR